jgi:PIN domain nuclease of toxin-antitoxin system
VILDTHVWLRYVTPAPLARVALRKIERARAEGALQIASVTLWEVALLVFERRYHADGPIHQWLRDALVLSDTKVAPLDPAVARESVRLVRVLRDPADCQIAGTALALGEPLATRDQRILENAKLLGIQVVEA